MLIEIHSPNFEPIEVKPPPSWGQSQPVFFCRTTEDRFYQKQVLEDRRREKAEKAAASKAAAASGDAFEALAAAFADRFITDEPVSPTALRFLVMDWYAADADGNPIEFNDTDFLELVTDVRRLPDGVEYPRFEVGKALRLHIVREVVKATRKRQEAQAEGEAGSGGGSASS